MNAIVDRKLIDAYGRKKEYVYGYFLVKKMLCFMKSWFVYCIHWHRIFSFLTSNFIDHLFTFIVVAFFFFFFQIGQWILHLSLEFGCFMWFFVCYCIISFSKPSLTNNQSVRSIFNKIEVMKIQWGDSLFWNSNAMFYF